MNILPYEKKYAQQIADLLNNYLPFLPETAETVDQAGGVRFICLDEQNQVVGYIAGYEITNYEAEFPFFEERLGDLKSLILSGTSYYTSHFVVHPTNRRMGIGSRLVKAYVEKVEQLAENIIVVGWVQSDTNSWAAEKSFVHYGLEPFKYIPRYFEKYEVDCPSCQGLCYCDAHIFIKKRMKN